MEVVLEGNLRRLKKYTLFRTKWVEHYFVMYCRDSSRNLYSIDEYKNQRKKQLKKSFKLEFVNRVESNLCLADHTISCSSGSPALNWIFSIGFRFQGVQKDLYLVAANDEEMNKWIREVCQVCKLQRQFEDPYENFNNFHPTEDIELATTSISGRSISSQTLETNSDILLQNYNDGGSQVTVPNENRMQMFNFGKNPKRKNQMTNEKRSVVSNRSLPRDQTYSNLSDKMETCSDTSSLCSSRKNATTSTLTTEDDSRSVASNTVPIPPPRIRHYQNQKKATSVVQKLNQIPASTSMGPISQDDNDSSGETLKNVDEQVQTEENPNPHRRNNSGRRRAPPPVDRSNKPKNLRQEDDRRYRNISKNVENHYSYSRTTKTESKRRNFDYFEPSTENLEFSNTRSPTPSDVEYIVVDVDRTLAFKQMRKHN
ncbi:unnamed protein product [Caenorhabditis angaria]|uniref:PH domain-containing protein n=1 Tax=Caenorhabditis angaria TaxID=860376 RepID=A0A9P1IY22_9PELO|nr:unnamed protein product [Caenorhabditis angaria]